MSPNLEQAPERPLVRYHGGKWRLAPWIIEQFPEHTVYVEPFGGAASVLLRKPRCYAEVYNDLDGEMVNLFRVVRDHGCELYERLDMTPFARDEFLASYEPSPDPIEQARRTVARCSMGFGATALNTSQKTGFRGSSTRDGSTPAMDWGRQGQNVLSIVERMRGVIIENRDAMEVMAMHDGADTLHYVDPPYVHDTRTWQGGKEAYRHELTDDQHRALGTFLGGLKGAVIVSGYPSELYEELFSGWVRIEREAMADARAKRVEVLWMRNVRPAAQGVLL